MIESITIGDISNVLVFLAGVLSSCGVIASFMSKHIRRIMDKEMGAVKKCIYDSIAPLDEKIEVLADRVRQVDVNTTKNYLQRAITAIDNGEKLDLAAKERFYENYDHYTNDLKLNSWVRKEVERLEKENKL